MDEFINSNEPKQDVEANDATANEGFKVVSDIDSKIHDTEKSAEETLEEKISEEISPQSKVDANDSDINRPVYNPIKYSSAEPIKDYKPMSRGLKIFSLVMAAVIVLTSVSIIGYFLGRNSIDTSLSSAAEVDLESRPKDTDQMTEAQVYEQVNKSIVGIVVYNSSGAGSQASGIVYSEDGYIITNDHIYSEVPAAKFKIYTYDGKEYDAEYVAGDKISDLAVLKIEGADLTPATFGNSDEIFYGEHVVAIGRPYDATDASSITRGVISAVSRRVQTTSSYSSRLIQTDSTINPGSSGGALVNMYGQVIGVTSSKLASVEYEAVGYAIPTTTMKRIAEELIKNKKVVSRAKLGITYSAIDSITAEIKGYEFVGLLISSVDEESGLYGKAQEGDIITRINGIEITDDEIVLDIIEQKSAGDTVSITLVTSDRATKTFDVELKANVSESSYIESQTNEQEPDILEPLPDKQEEESSGNDGIFNFPFGE